MFSVQPGTYSIEYSQALTKSFLTQAQQNPALMQTSAFDAQMDNSIGQNLLGIDNLLASVGLSVDFSGIGSAPLTGNVGGGSRVASPFTSTTQGSTVTQTTQQQGNGFTFTPNMVLVAPPTVQPLQNQNTPGLGNTTNIVNGMMINPLGNGGTLSTVF